MAKYSELHVSRFRCFRYKKKKVCDCPDVETGSDKPFVITLELDGEGLFYPLHIKDRGEQADRMDQLVDYDNKLNPGKAAAKKKREEAEERQKK